MRPIGLVSEVVVRPEIPVMSVVIAKPGGGPETLCSAARRGCREQQNGMGGCVDGAIEKPVCSGTKRTSSWTRHGERET